MTHNLRQERLRRSFRFDSTLVMCQGCKMLVWEDLISVRRRSESRPGARKLRDFVVLCKGCEAYILGEPVPRWWDEQRKNHRLCAWTWKQIERSAISIVRQTKLDPQAAFDSAIRLNVPIVTKADVQPQHAAMSLHRVLDYAEVGAAEQTVIGPW